jgi:GNAT superfamily N-acetyltransferase
MPTERIIKAANRDAIEPLQDLQARAGVLFRDVGLASVADNPSTPSEVFLESIGSDLLHVLTIGTQFAGFTLAVERGRDCHLEQMSVDPKFARQGIGSALMRHLIELAVARAYARISLSTFVDIPWNAPFYARFGFVPLPAEALSSFLVSVQRDEAEAGLDMARRTIMALEVERRG